METHIGAQIMRNQRLAAPHHLASQAAIKRNPLTVLVAARGDIQHQLFAFERPNGTGRSVEQVAGQFSQMFKNLMIGLR